MSVRGRAAAGERASGQTPDAAGAAATAASVPRRAGSPAPVAGTPPRSDWPGAPRQSPAGAALTEAILETFRLNARLLEVAQDHAAAGGLTAAWWQVLGGVLDEPRSVADVGRLMGVSRQSVQRIADLLVDRGLAEYRPNPAHRRAKLLACTEAGYWAIRRVSIVNHPWSDAVGAAVGEAELRAATETMRRLVRSLDAE